MIKPIHSSFKSRKSQKSRGAVLVEAALALVWFGITYFFILYMYQYLEGAQEARVVSGSQMRGQLIAQSHDCYAVVEHEYEGEVGNTFALEALFQKKSLPIEIAKLGFSGACPGYYQSRYDRTDQRQTQTPEGAKIGAW